MKLIKLMLVLIFCILSHLNVQASTIITGADNLQAYLPIIQHKKVAIVMNQTSQVNGCLLLDTLLSSGINVVKVFVPEHGFRGNADAGATITNGKDAKTGVAIISLYGKNKKPSQQQLQDIDIIIYDLQDVGVRFYTYISTLQYVMEACAIQSTELLILDRPNPNGHVIDGPILDTSFRSFVGMQPIPILYGLTPAEYAKMLVGEKWIPNASKLKMHIIPCQNYSHHSIYKLPVWPSPNLKSMAAVYLYPSMCFFEGTIVSLGRGTNKPFQQWGHPEFKSKSSYYFTPKSMEGATKPLLENQLCYGQFITDNDSVAYMLCNSKLNLEYLLKAYQWSPQKVKFFNSFFEKLAGTNQLRKQIQQNWTEAQIRKSWQPGIEKYKKIRKKYLIYAD